MGIDIAPLCLSTFSLPIETLTLLGALLAVELLVVATELLDGTVLLDDQGLADQLLVGPDWDITPGRKK